MSEESRLEFQRYYFSVCRDSGWLSEDGTEIWPEDDFERATVARELSGLALIFGTDSLSFQTKEQLNAKSLNATPVLDDAIAILSQLSDDKKSASLTLIDDVLNSAVHRFTLQLDRFDHGFLSPKFRKSALEECTPIPETEVAITSDDSNELFQDAVRWKDKFSRGMDIGRPEDPYRV